MAVNENVYGDKNLWHNAYFQQSALTNKNKLPYFNVNRTTLLDGTRANKLSFSEPIDKSISFCGLGTESALSHIAYANYVNGNVEITDIQDRTVTNFAFFEKNNTVSFTAPTSYYYDHLNWFAWQSTYDDNVNYQRLLSPLTLVNPHNLILSIIVDAYDTNFNNSVKESLKNYIANHTTSYPYIHRVTLKVYFGNISETTSRDTFSEYGTYRIAFQLGILDEYEINSKNLSFYAYGLNDFPVFGNIQTIPYVYNNSDSFGMILHTENSLPHIKTLSGTNDTHVYTEYYSEFEQDIMKTVACFGLYFTPNDSIGALGSLTDNDMYIGLLDGNGIGHGEYLRGANTVNAPQNNWNDMTDSGYDYEKDVDKTKYRNDTQFYAGYGTSSFTKFYALTETQVNQLSQELYRIANDVPSGTSITEYNMKMFLTNNPIDCIISLKKFPVENIPLASSDATIYLGAKATNITGKILATPTWVYYFNFRNSADQSCRPIFGDNFLDYEPYTKCKIVIPFCGTVDVPVSYIYQYDDLQIALVMDFITGAVTAYILVNGITIDSITGSCAIDLPVSGIQSATLDSQIHSVAMAREKQQSTLGTGLIAGAVSIGIGLATGNLPAAIGGGAAIIGSFMHAEDTGKQINYELSHMETPVKQVSAASGQIAHTYDMRCKMIITRPTIADEYSEEEYANTIGYACLINTTVRELHGFTVGTINLDGIDATAKEKEMIQSAFASGVYLP